MGFNAVKLDHGEMKMEANLLWLTLTMTLAGVAGGTVNFAMQRTENDGWMFWFQNTATGLGASFLVPLFLNTISSDLVNQLVDNDSSNGSPADIFIFFGFCLIAAISSKNFIRTLTDKIIRETRETKREVEAAKEDINEIQTVVSPLVEAETPETELPTNKKAAVKHSKPLSADEKKILKALTTSRYTLRSMHGLSNETGIGREKISQILPSLIEKRWATKIQGKKGIRWGITVEGTRYINK